MKQVLSAIVLSLCSLACSLALAATPVGPMNYQGRLLDNAGIPVTGSHNFVVKIYNDPAAGTLKYQETKTGVVVDDGVYSFQIGTGPKTGGDSLWDIDLWQQNLNDLYLEVVVNGETLSPRHELTSAPHAFTATLALNANSVAYLGGQSTSNVLVAICQANKGVWLNIANKCLGPGSDFSVAAVGGSVVNISTLHSGTDFTGIDLSRANIAGINFGAANFTRAVFKETTYNSNGIKATGLSNSAWDGAVDVNSAAAGSAQFTGSIQGMVVKNMNLSKWNLSSTNTSTWPNYYLFSAAELTACPGNNTSSATYLAHVTWLCREQYTGSGRYMVLGHATNLGAGSALVNPNNVLSTNLNMDGINLQSTRFNGVSVPVNFVNNWMPYAEFTGATLVGSLFIDAVSMDNVNFDNAKLDGVVFSSSTGTWANWSLKKASLNNVIFNKSNNQLTNMDFSGAYLNNVSFNKVSTFNFSNAILSNTKLDVEPASTATFNGTTITGNLKAALYKNGLGENGKVTFTNTSFINANITKDTFGGVACTDCGVEEAYFVNSKFSNVTIDSIKRADFTNCTISQLHITGSAHLATFTGTNTSSIFFSAGAICPNGTTAATAGWGFNVCGM